MANFFAKLWQGLTSVVDILWPLSRHARLTPAVRWTLHILLILAIALGLLYLQQQDWIKAPGWLPNRTMQQVWIPLMFLAIYALALIGWWLWTLVAFAEEVSVFSDIDAAWQEGVFALAQAGIRLSDLPLFLILGRPESGERNWFESAHLNLVVKPTPNRHDAPLRVCTDRDGVYVTCVGTSSLGRWAGVLALEEMSLPDNRDAIEPNVLDDPTMRPDEQQRQLMEDLKDAETGEHTTLQRRRFRRLSAKSLGRDFLHDSRETNKLKDRLAHLCRLIVRDRQPYCPINGIMLLLPLGGTDTEEEAKRTRIACRNDLDTVRKVVHMNCPLFTVVCDLESFPGFLEFTRRLKPKELERRVGQRFPLATNLAINDHIDHIRSAAQWLSNAFLQKLIYKYFQVERAGETDREHILAGNTFLFQFLNEMRDRADKLSDILAHIVARDDGGLWMFGGCYIAATGDGGKQAFVHDLFKRLHQEQSKVTWTPAALAEDAKCHAQTRMGYGLVALGWLAIVGLIVWLIWVNWFKKNN